MCQYNDSDLDGYTAYRYTGETVEAIRDSRKKWFAGLVIPFGVAVMPFVAVGETVAAVCYPPAMIRPIRRSYRESLSSRVNERKWRSDLSHVADLMFRLKGV